MPQRIVLPEWRAENEPTPYPFAEGARLRNDAGDVLLEGLILDLTLFPIGGQARLYLSRVNVEHDRVTLWIGDALEPLRASATFDLVEPPATLPFADPYGRPAGLLISEPLRLASFQAWDVGEHVFTPEDSEFAASCCVPTPELGLRGLLLEDGTLFTGDVWFVGEEGVVVRYEEASRPDNCDSADPYPVLRFDAVGDPLFRRKRCEPPGVFAGPRFIRRVRVQQPLLPDFICFPDERGELKITVHNELAPDTVLRIRTTIEGVLLETVGEPA